MTISREITSREIADSYDRIESLRDVYDMAVSLIKEYPLPITAITAIAVAIFSDSPLGTGVAVVAGSGALIAGNRDHILKRLLSDVEWIKSPKSLSSAVKYKLIQLFSAYKSNMESFQPCLPRMPIPDLSQTCVKYLKSVQPLLSEDEFHITKAVVQDFLRNEGKQLQQHLRDYASTRDNWLEEIWLKEAYLKGRAPLPFSTNIYALGSTKERVYKPGANPQLIRACYLIKGSLTFRNMIETGSLPPEKYFGIPVSMDQYHSLFATTRIPKADEDELVTYRDSRHLILVKNNHFIKFDCYCGERPLTLREIWHQLKQINQMFDETATEGLPVTLFTAQGRDQWAADREELLKSEKNREALHWIESAMGLISLDTEENASTEDFVSQVFLSGKNRWYDKSLQAIIAPSGKIGFNAEHSGADGTIISAMVNHIFSTEEKEHGQENGTVLLPTPNPISSNEHLTPPQLLEWEENSEVFQKISDLQEEFEKQAQDYDIKVFYFNGYGKGEIKKMGLSPDAFLQMAIQLAYYTMTKKLTLTYETASTRMFLNGRTETIRSLSNDSKNFVLAMFDPSASAEDRKSALFKAVKSHVQYTKEASLGEGVDRHLLGLKAQADAHGIESPLFADKSFNLEWKLLTSQTPCPTSLGGGFSPGEGGYGISYHVFDKNVFFNITSKKSCEDTSSNDFAKALEDSLMNMLLLVFNQ